MNPCPWCSSTQPDIINESVEKTLYHCRQCHKFFEIISAKNKKKEERNFFKPSNSSPSVSQVRLTSKKSFQEGNEDGFFSTQRKAIFIFISENPNVCIREVSEGLGIQKSSVSARMNELKAEGKIMLTGRKMYGKPIAKEVETWQAKEIF